MVVEHSLGKDPTKVDRSAAYMARCVAVSVVQSNLANKCQVAISYAIGKADPVRCSGRHLRHRQAIPIRQSETLSLIHSTSDRPAIIEFLKLKDTDYSATSTYGHFGGSERWERNHFSQELMDGGKKV